MNSGLIIGTVLGVVILVSLVYRRSRRRRTEAVSPGRAIIAANLAGSRRRDQ